jgi:hypothetical protein
MTTGIQIQCLTQSVDAHAHEVPYEPKMTEENVAK